MTCPGGWDCGFDCWWCGGHVPEGASWGRERLDDGEQVLDLAHESCLEVVYGLPEAPRHGWRPGWTSTAPPPSARN